MKKNRVIISIIYLLLLVTIIVVVIAARQNKYSTYLVMNNDGYLISQNVLTKNLLNDEIDFASADCEGIPFYTSDIVYEKSGKYYLSDDKVPINDIYPLFINSASTTMSLTGNMSLVSDDFERAQAYSGLYINEGISFNEDMERAYREEFILLSLSNGLFVNVKTMNITGNFFIEKSIPTNSIIRFMENEIRYYSLKNDVLSLNSIEPCGSTTKVIIDQMEYSYFDFLERLGIYEKAALREKEKEAMGDEFPPAIVEATPTPQTNSLINNGDQSADKSSTESEDKNIIGGRISYEEEEFEPSIDEATPTPKVGAKPSKKPDKESLPEGEEIPKPTGIAQNNSSDNEEYSDKAPSPAKPAAEALPADLPELVSTSDNTVNDDPDLQDDPEDPEDEDDTGNPEWKKPEVFLNDFITSVYAIKSPQMVIENSEFLYRSGVSFNVYEGSRLIIRKAYGASSDVNIAPLKPDTDYKVIATMEYFNKFGVRETESIKEVNLHTKPLSDLEPLRFNWSNGELFYNKIQLAELTITNAVSSVNNTTDDEGNTVQSNSYIETVQFMNRIEVVITAKEDSSLSYTIPVTSVNLKDLKNGNSILYESGGRIKSNTEYYYEFICYDRYGNLLPMEGVVRGTTHTCKQPPVANITVLKNEIKNVEVRVSIDNVDGAEIVDGSILFCVYDRDNSPVMTTISLKDNEGNYSGTETSIMHSIPYEGATIKFLDLLDYEVFNFQVYSSYYINDGHGLYELAPIGRTKFTTMPISALGFAFFNIEFNEIIDNSATFTLSLDRKRTDSRLLSLISGIDVSILRDDTKESDGIKLLYGSKDEVFLEVINGELPDNNGLISFTEEELENMKLGDVEDKDISFTFHAANLQSITKYDIAIIPRVLMGSTENSVYRDIKAFYSPDAFTTMKKTAVIDIDAIYASRDFIKLYGVSINDPDGAIISFPVTMDVYDDANSKIASFEITSMDKVPVFDVSKLKKDKAYTFRFFASEYNNGTDAKDMRTYRKNHELYYSELSESKQYLVVSTREAVSGSIDLQEMNRNKIIDRVEIPAKDITSHTSGVSLYQGFRLSSNSNKLAKYSMEVDFGNQQWNSFQIGYSYIAMTTYSIYLEDPDLNPEAQPIATKTVEDRTRSADYSRWTDIEFFDNDINISGKQTIYLVAKVNTGGIHCLWGVRFMNTKQSDSEHYYANLKALVDDTNNELGSIPSYKIKVYEDGVWIDTRRHEWTMNSDGTTTLRMYQVAGDKTETLVDIKIFSGEERICDTDFYYEVSRGHHTYVFELWVIVFDYEIKLDQEELTTELEIIGIRTADDLANVRYGTDRETKYYVINDIIYPLGWNNITASLPLHAELDFRGHTLIYNSSSQLITTIGSHGSLKNMVLEYAEGWGSDTWRSTSYLVTYNYGTIQNQLVNYTNGNKEPHDYRSGSALVYTNYESGTIENFVINYKDSLVSTNDIAGACVYNRGMVRNGYVYGEPIKMTKREYLFDREYSNNLIVGGVVAANRQSGNVENVYSLVDIETRDVLSANDYAFCVVGLNDGTLLNSFSTGDVLYGGVVRQDLGPAYRNRYSANMVRNTYYYSEVDYGNTNNILIAKLLLYDLNWYDRMFNREKSSRKGQFNLKPLQMGYFPHVIWPSFMPEQEYNPLPVLIEEDEIKIIDTSIIEQENNYAIALITFDNPDNFEVSEIKTQWLNTEIISQFNDDGFYRVTVRLTQALDTKYYSDYEITSFIYKFGLTGSSWNKEFAAGEGPTIPAEFYKPIITVSDWNSIKNDYYQNYRLHADLDFQYLAQEVAVLPANLNLATTDSKFKIDAFNGKLDGNNHKISFVDTGDYGYVIGKLLGSVRDLDVAYLDVRDGDGRYKGFIGRMLEGSSVDNVHILGMDAISYEHCGAIAGDVYAGTITNSSAHNINIVSTADGNYTQFIGGLVGKHRVSSANTNYANLVIENSYINGINIETKRAGDCGGVGGLVGYIRAGAEISNVYVVNGVIDTVFKNAGGLIGSIDTFTSSDSEFYMLKDYYVDVDITTNTERAGGIIGFSRVKNAEKEEHGLTLGNISTNKYSEDVSELEVGRYYGSYPPKTPKEIEEEIGAKTIYGYEYSVLNGIINPRNPEGILTEERLLTYAQLCDIDTYGIDGELYWEADFIRDDEEQAAGILPKLKAIGREESLPDPEESDSEKLLPYQEDYYLENNPITVKSISSTPYQSGELFYVDIELVHSSDILVNDADFNGLMIADLAGAEESFSVDVTDTGTVLHYVLGINGYYDTYYLTGINYTLSEASLKQSMYLSVGITPQFLEIGAVDQWNSLMSSDMHGLKGYNVRITGDLDFNMNGRNAKTNVIVNRLVGGNEITRTIKGITINGGDSFVAAAQGEVSYLNFEDINITKDMASAPELINSVGIFAAIIGDMHDVDFTNITIDADCSAYTGLVGLGYGMYYNNTLQNITVKGGSFRAGQVPGKGAVGGLVARLSGSGGMYDNTATNMIVEGRTYVGGLLGIQEEGRYLWNNEVNNAVVSSLSATAAYDYVGGIAGAANDTALSNIGGNNRLNHSVVLGSNYVGGLIGLGSMMGDYSLTGTTAENMIENDKYSSTAEQVFVAGIGSYVGGIAGQGVVRRTEVRDADIYGILWIGGVTGNGSVYYASVTDATIGTVYDRNAGDTGNMVFRKKVEDKIEYYRNLKDMTLEDGTLAVYTETINLLQHLITTARTGSWSNAPLGSTNNSRIGGIAGRTIAVANAIVANSRIGSYNANAVGGIVGITQLSSYNTGGYRIISSGTMNCEIYGADDIGGIVGTHYRAYIESCYSNSNVTATRKNAGGIAGRVNDTALYSITETPRANHVYYAGTVTAPENVAGIFGLMEQPLYSTNEGWLMAGNVVVTNSEKRGNYFYNKYQGDSQRITLAMVYDDSKITFGSETKNSLDYYRDNPQQFVQDDIKSVSTTNLKLSSTYTNADTLNWSSGTATSSTNYSSRYWNYNGLINGYMPYITHAPTNNYKMSESIRVLKYQEDYMPDEDDDTKIAIDDKGMYIYQYETYQGGVPVPGSGAITRRLFKMAKMNFNVPTAKFYTVDADKLNLEFSEINPEAAFQVKAAGVIIAESNINQRVFTLNYDFRTELEILVTDGVDEISYEIWPEDVSRNIMTWDSDYYYITSGGVMGSMDTMEGQYVNLYAGHALDAYGVVYDMTTGDQMYIFEGISLAKTVQPLHSFEYDGYKIETNADYSVVREVTRDKLRLYVKNNELSAISSGMSLIIDSLILDNYNGDKYCSVLSTEGMIVNMTDKELVMPDDFVNEEIQYMTHNINSTNHILLVRYYDGAVAGFNYISGEKLDINSPRGTSTLLTTENGMMGRSMNTSLANFSLLYMDIMEFKTDLTDIGWAEVNGINIESGEAVSAADAEIHEEGSLALYVEDAFELDDGTLVGVDKPSIVSADQLLRADKTEFANFIPENEGLYSDYISELADSPLPLAVSEVPSEVVNNILEIKIASLDAAINAANKYGASHAELMALQKELEYLKTIGATEAEIVALKTALAKVTKDGTLEAEDTWFVSDAYAGTAEAALLDSMKEAAAKDNMSKVEDPDNLAEDAAIDNLPKAAADGSKTLVSNSKSDFDDAAEVEKDKKKTSKIATNKKISTPIYITVYDEETSKYVMYDEQELLTKKDEELKTMNEKVERSGHMIDYRAKQVVDVKKPVDENIYGYILLSVAISGIALLLSAMMLRKRKEAVV